MRYMMLVYSQEKRETRSIEEIEELKAAHWAVMDEATRKGVLLGAEPLASTAMATTVRVREGKPLITDGPFAETKEHLAGYYILECENLEAALEWAAKIPTGCRGAAGCVEVRPMPGLPSRADTAGVGQLAARGR